MNPAVGSARPGDGVAPATDALRHALVQFSQLSTRDSVPSPCISVCTMNAASGLCTGCLRTLDEIAAWSTLRDEDKRAVWKQIEQRIKRSPQ
jgi:hypothetical protein